MVPFRHPESTYGTGSYDVIEEQPQPPVLSLHGDVDWLTGLKQAIDRPEASKRLIVYIHGYATSFEEAHTDAAKVRALAGGEIPIVLLHWPSRARASAYLADRSTIAWAQKSITRQLSRLTHMADDITVVSHSLGAEALANAVLQLDSDPLAMPERIKRIVMASPDVDRHQFLRRHGTVDSLQETHQRKVLIYASSKDKALQASRNFNGYARLGSTSCEFDVVYARRELGEDSDCHVTEIREGLAIIDTGLSDASGLLRHSDYLDSCQVREDLRAFLHDRPPPPYRQIILTEAGRGYRIDASHGILEEACNSLKEG